MFQYDLVLTTIQIAKRKRCGICDGCTAIDCGECNFCQDKPKFGGTGVLKQCCVHRKCKVMKLNHNGSYVTIDVIQSDILCYFIADSSSCTPISSETVKSEEMILIV